MYSQQVLVVLGLIYRFLFHRLSPQKLIFWAGHEVVILKKFYVGIRYCIGQITKKSPWRLWTGKLTGSWVARRNIHGGQYCFLGDGVLNMLSQAIILSWRFFFILGDLIWDRAIKLIEKWFRWTWDNKLWIFHLIWNGDYHLWFWVIHHWALYFLRWWFWSFFHHKFQCRLYPYSTTP